MPTRYQEIYARSIQRPDEFWAEAAADLHWYKPWNRVLDDTNAPFYRWFEGGELNTCYNALDIHLENGKADAVALIYDSPVTSTRQSFSYRELHDNTARFAGALAAGGVQKGDTVLIYMPMIPEAIIAMLACARLGAIHCVVFGGFAANELAVRIDHAKPKLIVSASCGIEPTRLVEYKPLLDEAQQIAEHSVERVVYVQRAQHRVELLAAHEVDWRDLMDGAPPVDCVPVLATDPLYILYTSGTTGQPKGVVRDNGGHAVALKWTMQHIYDVRDTDTFWAASDIGWVVGHSYIVYGPLLNGNTTVLYEGKPVGTPDAGAFGRVISENNVSVLFTAPTAMRSIKKEDPDGAMLERHSRDHLRSIFLAGERTDPNTHEWTENVFGVPVIDHWWQTETGWAICADCRGIEQPDVRRGSVGKPAPGMNVAVLNTDGKSAECAELGTLVLRLPMPPGSLLTLWDADERYVDSYLSEYPDSYNTSDAGYIDQDGYVFVMGRTDDVINIAGHRLSTGAMEEVLAAHPDVAECAVVGVADPLKGQLPLAFLVLKSGTTKPESSIIADVIALVRETIGPVAAFRSALVVDRLPKTRSGKILRKTMRQIADGDDWEIPATIDDPSILNEIRGALDSLPNSRI